MRKTVAIVESRHGYRSSCSYCTYGYGLLHYNLMLFAVMYVPGTLDVRPAERQIGCGLPGRPT